MGERLLCGGVLFQIAYLGDTDVVGVPGGKCLFIHGHQHAHGERRLQTLG